MRGMVINMSDEQMHTLAQLQAFVDGTPAVDFAVAADERYDFIARTIRRFGYGRLGRGDKAIVLRFLERVSGYSRQQIARLVKRGCERRPLSKRYKGSRTRFARTYTGADVLLLAHTDALHGTLSGLATGALMERAFLIFSETRDRRPSPSASAAPRRRTTSPATCAWTPSIITSDLVGVNQRLMSPYFGDLAEWLCIAFCQPSRMASSSIKASKNGFKRSITSTPWTASPSMKGWQAASASARHSSSPCSKNCC